MRRHFVAFLLFISCTEAQINNSGSVTAYVDSLITQIPDAAPSNLYQVPTAGERTIWESVISEMLKGNYAAAHSDASAIDYQVVHYTDTTNSKIYYVLLKTSAGMNYWGTFIIDTDPLRSRLFIQAPHPLHDANTGNQAIVVFKNTAARAFILAGTHRCNSTALSGCDGTTSVCGGSNQFRKSDQAHNSDGTFQITTEVFKRSIPNLIVVQLHGFVKDPGYPDLILGNGTQSAPATDWLEAFKNNLSSLDGTLQFKTAHVDTSWSDLTGTTNTQGRLMNNSPDPCGQAAVTPTGRFLHIEQAFTGLRDNAVSFAKVAAAVSGTFLPDKMIVSAASGNWENSSTWTGNVVPNDTTHVVIASGHTITVTTPAAQAKSVSFLDNSASIALAAGSNLSVYGDMMLSTESHNAFSSWASGSTITFAGGDDQVLNGWNTDSTNFSTALMEVVINKTAGKVVTSGSDMNLNIGTSLLVASGTFELTAGDDIEGRDLTGSAAAPSLTIQSAGVFIVDGDTSYIRRGTADTLAIGPVRNYGLMKFYGTDLNTGYNFSDIYNEAGGTIEIYTGWRSSRLLRVDTLLINAGSVFETSTTTNVIPSGGRTVLNAGGMYRVLGSSGNFSVNFTNNGTVEYASSSAQTVSERTYKRLQLSNAGTKSLALTTNRSADTLVLTGSASLNVTSASAYTLTANNMMMLSGGNITTNSNTLVLGQQSTLLGTLSRTSGSIVGNFKRYFAASAVNDVLFPLGDGTNYRPAQISFTSAPAVGGSVTAAYLSVDPGSSGLPLDDAGSSLENVAPEGYWKFNASEGLSGGIFSLDLYPNNYSGISTVATLRIVHRETAGVWQLQGMHVNGTGTASSPIVKRSGLSSFAEFGIAAGVDNPLPEELVSLTAVSNRLNAKLKWRTATEGNNYGFEIERKMIALHDQASGARNIPLQVGRWNTAGFIEGNGSSNTEHEYVFIDRGISAGTYAYRLKQIDRDGKFSYSHTVEVQVSAAPNVFLLEQNYPNPFNPGTTIRYHISKNGFTSLNVYDIIGREVALLVNEFKEAGAYSVYFDASHLFSGVYFAKLANSSSVQVKTMLLLK
jgi:hypothetical protein